MVKASDIVALIDRYLSEKKFDHLEALYMWSKNIAPTTIAPVLRNRYGKDVGYTTLTEDLSNLKITSVSDNTEDTRESINTIIGDLFHSKCVPELLDQIREKFKAIINPRDKRLLLALIRSGLFEKGDINLDELRLSYRTLFNEILDDYSLTQTITELEKVGVLYGERRYDGAIDRLKIPKYVYALSLEVEQKLPSVNIGEGAS